VFREEQVLQEDKDFRVQMDLRVRENFWYIFKNSLVSALYKPPLMHV
jgi:hypothetical protein